VTLIDEVALSRLASAYNEIQREWFGSTKEQRATQRRIAKLEQLLGRVVFRGKRRR
jgi:hypothetical protein